MEYEARRASYHTFPTRRLLQCVRGDRFPEFARSSRRTTTCSFAPTIFRCYCGYYRRHSPISKFTPPLIRDSLLLQRRYKPVGRQSAIAPRHRKKYSTDSTSKHGVFPSTRCAAMTDETPQPCILRVLMPRRFSKGLVGDLRAPAHVEGVDAAQESKETGDKEGGESREGVRGQKKLRATIVH